MASCVDAPLTVFFFFRPFSPPLPHPALDTFFVGLLSFVLTLMNILVIFIMGIVFLYIKSVAPVGGCPCPGHPELTSPQARRSRAPWSCVPL